MHVCALSIHLFYSLSVNWYRIQMTYGDFIERQFAFLKPYWKDKIVYPWSLSTQVYVYSCTPMYSNNQYLTFVLGSSRICKKAAVDIAYIFFLVSFQAYTSVSKASLSLADHRELGKMMNTIIFHTKMVDSLVEMLVETSDLSIFWYVTNPTVEAFLYLLFGLPLQV